MRDKIEEASASQNDKIYKNLVNSCKRVSFSDFLRSLLEEFLRACDLQTLKCFKNAPNPQREMLLNEEYKIYHYL